MPLAWISTTVATTSYGDTYLGEMIITAQQSLFSCVVLAHVNSFLQDVSQQPPTLKVGMINTF
jgi:hypothetical protein